MGTAADQSPLSDVRLHVTSHLWYRLRVSFNRTEQSHVISYETSCAAGVMYYIGDDDSCKSSRMLLYATQQFVSSSFHLLKLPVFTCLHLVQQHREDVMIRHHLVVTAALSSCVY